ncbi:MAG TPA: NnrS family protein [Povalibacter sp.]|uniref:NnrS family protein n=1 Tax=Povalibacter sp. TaxID=1962978 RepID=UPI002C7914E1|nr:NnrS family protein [Povalibacter sp.]HMN44590.1 NnrS family protein [Povalibacter sp.]
MTITQSPPPGQADTAGFAADSSRTRGFALFEYGFRPFFLLAGLYALTAVPLWLWVYSHGVAVLPGLPPHLWHGHEMLYGFIVAAIAGFLLTAVPSWTGSRGFGGRPLILLVAVWLAGRGAMVTAAWLPTWLVGVAELAFLPALAALLAPPLVRGGNRNTPLLAVIGVLWLADVAFIVAMRSTDALLAQRALRLAIDVILILVTVIGGRIVPAFTANALRRRGETIQIVVRPWLDPLVIAIMVAIAIVDVGWPDSHLAGVLAAIAAGAHALRLSGWRVRRIWREPILWVLHVGYAWMPVGLALKAVWVLTGMPWSAQWLHALTLGTFGTMILAVMTRASLGHTGRPLVVSRTTALSYVVLTAAVAVRVWAPAIADYFDTVLVAGALWAMAFALYLAVYAPILWCARADGKPG